MSSNLSDQEQIQLLKNWWKKYGVFILTGITAFLLSSYGWRFWQGYQVRQANLASATFNKILNEQHSGNKEEASLLMQHLTKEQGGSPYASLSALIKAKEAVENNQLAVAEKELMWVIERGKQNSMRQLARIRLARIFLEEQKAKQVLDILDKIEDETFLAAVFEAKADAFLKLDKRDEALTYYKKALALNEGKEAQAPLLLMKLQQF